MGIYVDRIERRLVATEPEIEIVKDGGGALLVDGGNGMGAVVTMRALRFGLERVAAHGTCAVAIRNSNHYGAGAFYVKEAVRHNVTVHMYSNAPPTMAPWGGVDPYLGTNPYSFGVPSRKYHPIILDMASSVVARGKIILAAKQGKTIPQGWAIDQDGVPTTDAQKALDGSVLPFAGPKGYGIALMIDILAGILTSSNFGPRIPDLYRDLTHAQNIGAFMQFSDIGFFVPPDEFLDRVDTMIAEIKAARKAPGVEEIYLPGEIEALNEERRGREGLWLEKTTIDMLIGLGKSCGLDFRAMVSHSGALPHPDQEGVYEGGRGKDMIEIADARSARSAGEDER
jgi:LDH2 family malate/lactate/ureidoglycolate dehydrogenase